MAFSTSTKQGSATATRLSDLLDEQQEPFVLEIYLLERGYRKSSKFFEGTNIGCCSNTKHDYYKNTKKSSITNIAKTLLNKLVSRKRRDRGGVGSTGSNCCSSGSCSSTISNSTHRHNESEQCSPNSVLDEIDLLQGVPVYTVKQPKEQNPAESGLRFRKKVSEDAILSASLWELLMHFRREKPKNQGRRKQFPQYIKSKKANQKEHQQLLFNCVREAVENGKHLKNCISNNREKGLKIGPEEVGKYIYKKLKTLRKVRKLSADRPNIQKVLRSDLFEKGVADEWGGYEVWKKEIVAEIGDSIADQITDEIISDMSYQS